MDGQKRIAIQGVAGAFHEVAARRFFGENISVEECDTFRILSRKLHNGEVDFALMAIENTIAGTLMPNYSLVSEFGLKIVGEVYLHIEMQLMALPGVQLEQVQFVHSHPIAIAQCREYLDTLQNVTVVEKNDTAESAQNIIKQNFKNVAAIAGAQAAQLYGLNVIVPNIHTNKQNFTRFFVLSREEKIVENANKTSLCFEIEHRSGSLAEVLMLFAINGLNLTKIQSVPILGKPYQYNFFIDLEWNDIALYRSVMKRFSEKVRSYTLLGEYERKSLHLVA
ncbi:MAG: prephenate dehydratase [Prevotellaceae bacterium]|jgi:prephenate dehydratase|nr:prephenate dehydratase [Prevotellaceae bacterium]